MNDTSNQKIENTSNELTYKLKTPKTKTMNAGGNEINPEQLKEVNETRNALYNLLNNNKKMSINEIKVVPGNFF